MSSQDTKYLALDIEATSINWCKANLIGIGQFSKEDGLIGFSKKVIDNIKDYEVIMHNGSYDVKVLRKLGIDIPYTHDTLIMASLLQFKDNIKDFFKSQYDEDRTLEDSLKLDSLAKRHLGLTENWKIDWNSKNYNYEDIKQHCLMDCRVTYFLFEKYKRWLKEFGLWEYYTKLMMPFQRLLVDVECNGIRLDMDKLNSMIIEYDKYFRNWNEGFYDTHSSTLNMITNKLKEDKISKIDEPIESIYYINNNKGNIISEKRYDNIKYKKNYTMMEGINPKDVDKYNNKINKIKEEELLFNPRSYIHMTKLLELKGYDLRDRTGKKTTSRKLLYRYKYDPIIKDILDYKEYNKIYNDFLCKWRDLSINNILYTNFRLWATRTGRLSSAEPNLQQVPKESNIRELFIPREGKVFTVADAKQMEARLAGYFSKEPNLIKAFKEELDVYGQIAVDLLRLDCHPNDVKGLYPDKRQIGKQLFLATIYGQGYKSLHFQLTKEYNIDIEIDECRKYKREFKKIYPKLEEFLRILEEEVNSKGYITNFFGRKIFIPRDKAYKAINYFIQGTSSEILSFSQLNIVPKLPKDAKLLLLVHDEVVFEHNKEDTKEIVDLIREYMIEYINRKYDMFIDLDIETGNNWSIK